MSQQNKVPEFLKMATDLSCDLLSKIVSLTIANNSLTILQVAPVVVICFQKLYL